MPPRTKAPAKFVRPQHFQTLLYSDILQSQQTDANGDLADTLLICDGGTIRVHAFLLQTASQLMQKAFSSQGEDYPYIREVLLPDFPVKDVEKMLNFVYKGYAELSTDDEVEKIKEIMGFFEISGIDFLLDNDEDCKNVKEGLKVQELNRIPQDIFKVEVKPSAPIIIEDSIVIVGTPSPRKMEPKSPMKNTNVKTAKRSQKKSDETPTPTTFVRRSTRPQKPIVNLNQGKKKDQEEVDNSDDSDYSISSNEETVPKRGKKPVFKQPAVRLPRTMNGPGTSNASTSSSSSTSNNTNNSAVVSVPIKQHIVKPAPAVENNGKPKAEDSGTDTEDEDWVKPPYKDKEWFAKESKRCQSCKKKHETAAGASLCVTSHRSLRCYFCFRVYSTTDVLFKHFRRRHRPAGRENTLICPFCDQSVPYKSVSCHVISLHLKSASKEKEENEKKSPAKTTSKNVSGRLTTPNSKDRGKRRSRSRSSSVERNLSSDRQPTKKLKQAPKKKPKLSDKNKQTDQKLQVRDLDVTIEKVTVEGKTLIFRIEKSRTLPKATES